MCGAGGGVAAAAWQVSVAYEIKTYLTHCNSLIYLWTHVRAILKEVYLCVVCE